MEFRDRATGNPLTVVNIHLEFKNLSNRRKLADLIAAWIAPLIEAGERVVLAGDLNAGPTSTPGQTIQAAGLRFRPVTGATNHFNRGV